MPSLQLLQLTEHGRGFLASKRKSLLLATSVLVAGGAALYMQSRLRHKWSDSSGHCAGPGSLINDSENGIARPTVHTGQRPKKSGLRSLQVLVAILLSRMGRTGARDLLYLVSVVFLYAMGFLSFLFFFFLSKFKPTLNLRIYIRFWWLTMLNKKATVFLLMLSPR